MQKFNVLKGVVANIDRANIDTDAIIPKQYLKSNERTGFGKNIFDYWRYLDEIDPKTKQKKPNPNFVLNNPRFKNASILLTRENFGCGSSREHAVWALTDYGFRVVIAPSFADIFFNNGFKNGLLPISLKSQEIDKLFDLCNKNIGFSLKIDLEKQVVTMNNGEEFLFEIDKFRKNRLLNGLDDIDTTLQFADEIKIYEKNNLKPWLV